MPDRLVHLELHLLGVDHDRRHAGGALVGAEERGRLLGDARRLPLEPERLDVLPAGLRARPDVRARVAARLEQPVADRHRVDSAAALDELLLDLGAVRGEEELPLAERAHRRLRDLHVRVPQAPPRRGGRARPCRRARRRTGRARPACGTSPIGPRAVRARACRSRRRPRRRRRRGARRRVRPRPSAAGRTRSPTRRSTRTRTPTPSVSDVGQRLDAAVLRADGLRPARDGARVGVRRPRAERRIHTR